MKKWFPFLFLGLLLLSFSCKNESSSKKDSKAKKEKKVPVTPRDFYLLDMQEVIDDHDTLMKDLSKINHFIQQLESEDIEMDPELKEKAVSKLKKANKSMYAWMYTFNKRFPNLNLKEKDGELPDEEYEKRIEMLKHEKETLKKMKKEFKESFEVMDTLQIPGIKPKES